MPRPSWKTNLTNAFPIPDDKLTLHHQTDTFDRAGIFPFLSLPPEIRNRIYFLNWHGASTSDLHHKPIPPLSATDRGRLNLTLVSRRLHAESTHLLYSTTTFRLFPLQDFQYLPTPLSLPPHYRSHITSLSLIVGSSWTNPPASWKVGKGLIRALSRIKLLRVLKIFVEVDPSIPMFARYRRSEGFYTEWCGELVRDVLKAIVGTCEIVEADGNPGVDPRGQLASRICEEVRASGRVMRYGPDWKAKLEAGDAGMLVTMAAGVALEEVYALADGLKFMEVGA
jgi:hypothetical protein